MDRSSTVHEMDSSNNPHDDTQPTLEKKEKKKRGPTLMPQIMNGASSGQKI